MGANVIVPEAGTRRITRMIAETAYGVTPVGAWDILRNTGGNGIAVQYTTQESEELGGTSLGIQDQIRVDTLGSAEYPFEYSDDPLFDLILESIMNKAFAANVLVPGDVVKTFTIEDNYPTIKEYQHMLGSRATNFQITVENGQPVKGSMQFEGSSVGVNAARTVAVSNDLNFVAPNQIVSTAGSDPFTGIVAGDFVMISGAAAAGNNGYFKVLTVATKTLTLDGTVTNATATNPTITANPISLVGGGTVNPKNTSSVFRAGNNVTCLMDGVDVLRFGFRIPQLQFTIATPNEKGREITEDSPYVTVISDRTVEISIQWHVINLEALRRLVVDDEFEFSFTVSDGTNFRTFRLPRAKFAEGSPGAAGRGTAIMTGSARIIGLLSSGVNLEITRSA